MCRDSSTSEHAPDMPMTARLKISGPSKIQFVSPYRRVRSAYRVPMPSTTSVLRASLSQPRRSASTPSSRSVASSTTAAHPSPKRTATPRLFQSMKALISSPPSTSALRTTPVRIMAVAVLRPYRKLVHAVLTSIAAAFFAPSRTWMPDAWFGTWSSKLQVPKMISSMSAGSMPAAASARRAAT